MSIDIKFDLAGSPEPPTLILANRNGNKLGQLYTNAESIELNDRFNDASELSFTVNKYIDNKITPLWDKIVDFKLVYCLEWDAWFEIKVELDEATETIKTVFCTQLGRAELSQIKLYNIEINTEDDIARDDYDEEYPTVLYRIDGHTEASLLHRLLKDKAPHYSIAHVDSTIMNIQRSFSFDDASICDAFDEIAEEIGCLFVYNSNSDENGIPNRTISVYDLQQYCNDCGYRGEFTDACPKCKSINIQQGYGEDTLIFATSDELASDGIELTTDVESVKNCFKLEAGDDLMTATVRNCNPNGTDYIWRFSEDIKEDMSDELVEKIESYDELYRHYYDKNISELDIEATSNYNALVDKYSVYNKDLPKIETSIVGYSNLMKAYYNTIDLSLYLKSGLMPNVEMSKTNAEEQAKLLTASALSPVAVNVKNTSSISLETANSAVLSMAKVIVKSTFKVEILTSTLFDDNGVKKWCGTFEITNYSDENDMATIIIGNDENYDEHIIINNDTETFIKQKIDKALNKENTEDLSITGLFEREYDDFCAELKKYALNPLKGFYDACDACLNILIDQGAGSKDENPDLYENLYEPYYNKSSAIVKEIKIREEEISVIEGVWNKTNEGVSELVTKGIRQYIEECRDNIHNALNFENYLGKNLWFEFCLYRREDKYSNDNYISDGLNNTELFKRALEFFEVAENEIYKASELQHSISTTLNNLLSIPKFKPLIKSFKVGNWIRVQIDDKIYKLRLLEYSINFNNFNNIPVEFSDVTKVKNGITDIQDILSQASSMAASYSSIQRQANQGNSAKNTLNRWMSDGLCAAEVQINSNTDEDIQVNKNGLLCLAHDDITGEELPEQLKITYNIMAYTDDNWKTVKQAIGKHKYFLYSKDDGKFIEETGYGVSSSFVNAGIVSGSQIIGGDIYSYNYSTTENLGSYLNLADGTFSFAGGKLTYDGDHLSVDGEVTIATSGTIGCWDINNFSIYKGSETFGNADGMYFGTEGLSLSDAFKVTSVGVAEMTKVNITGGMIGDWKIDDDKFISNNNVISSNGTFTFMPSENNYVSLTKNNTDNNYNFNLGSNVIFKFGSTTLTEDNLKNLLTLIETKE